jgi:hypothetical protein
MAALKRTANNSATKRARKGVSKSARRREKRTASEGASGGTVATTSLGPVVAPGSPNNFRARVRMYRQGLGDCFLLTLPRSGAAPFQILIDCGALERDKAFMTQIVEHIHATIRDDHANGGNGKARLDVVVATHEHKDHLSGFNQARPVFSDKFDFGAVWLGWTENLTKPEIKKIKEAKKKAVDKVRAALASPLAVASPASLDGVAALLAFSQDEDDTGTGKIADALQYLKVRGKDAGDLRYLEPGTGPLELEGLPGVRVYVLGPPRDPILLKGSEVTEKMKREGVIYHLARTGETGMEALSAAVSHSLGAETDRYHPFAEEHRLAATVPDPLNAHIPKPNPYFADIAEFVAATYNDATQAWRRIDDDWLSAFGQLALDLDNDTNNTSLVLAFEFEPSREVLLFVGDAQVGNWQSWAQVDFEVPGRANRLPALDLLGRTVFYKVGHHCSHNATLRAGGLELMTREDLVAFIPLDKTTAKKQGTKGWNMPAGPLFKALQKQTGKRVVISDVQEKLTTEAAQSGVVATGTFVDYFLT